MLTWLGMFVYFPALWDGLQSVTASAGAWEASKAFSGFVFDTVKGLGALIIVRTLIVEGTKKFFDYLC